jgi:hypothetical protein
MKWKYEPFSLNNDPLAKRDKVIAKDLYKQVILNLYS